jgi:type IV pilus assembly protein PilE
MEGIIRMNSKGVTFMEILVVLIIVGVLAVLYIPNMQDPIEKSRSRNAVFNLEAIYSAEKRYFLSERVYYNLSPDMESINRNLSIKVEDPNFNYSIAPFGSGYKAKAVRIDGKCKGANMTVTHDNSTVTKTGCRAW